MKSAYLKDRLCNDRARKEEILLLHFIRDILPCVSHCIGIVRFWVCFPISCALLLDSVLSIAFVPDLRVSRACKKRIHAYGTYRPENLTSSPKMFCWDRTMIQFASVSTPSYQSSKGRATCYGVMIGDFYSACLHNLAQKRGVWKNKMVGDDIPGLMIQTSMPKTFSSWRRDSDKPSKACFVAPVKQNLWIAIGIIGVLHEQSICWGFYHPRM